MVDYPVGNNCGTEYDTVGMLSYDNIYGYLATDHNGKVLVCIIDVDRMRILQALGLNPRTEVNCTNPSMCLMVVLATSLQRNYD